MAAQKGKDLLLKIDSTGLGAFVTVAGLRAKRLAFNSETVDVTDADSAGRWRELLAGSGRAARLAVGLGHLQGCRFGRRRSARSSSMPRSSTGSSPFPDFGTVEGPFQITALEYSGNHDGEVTFEIALELAGALSFAVAP